MGNLPQASVLRNAEIVIELNPYKRRLSEEEAGELLTEDVVGMIAGVEPLTERVLSTATGLKVISRCGVGLDNVDLKAASTNGIRVLNTPDAPTVPVAELTMGHILNLLRRVSLADSRIKNGHWEPQMGCLLAGKTVGIVGFGRIGRKVAELVIAFDAKVLTYDPVVTPSIPNVTSMSLDSLLTESDIVSLHVPYTPEARHLIGDKELRLMKPAAYLINVARGGLVNEQALYEALVANQLAGAGLDTFEQEPYTGPLRKLENVLLTAHMGSYAKEARALQEQEAAANLFNALAELKLIE